MTFKHRLELGTFSLIILAAFVGVFVAIYSNNRLPKINIFTIIPTLQEEQKPKVIPLEQPKITSQISPDGGKKVIMRTIYNEDSTRTYAFSISNNSGENEQSIFKKTLESTKSMVIPFNTWSPDNKYFFIQEQTNDGAATAILVFKALGETFAGGEKYLEVAELFKNRGTGNNFREATGWASETLIIVNSTTQDNTKGPSYWFEVPSKAIIQLATDF